MPRGSAHAPQLPLFISDPVLSPEALARYARYEALRPVLTGQRSLRQQSHQAGIHYWRLWRDLRRFRRHGLLGLIDRRTLRHPRGRPAVETLLPRHLQQHIVRLALAHPFTARELARIIRDGYRYAVDYRGIQRVLAPHQLSPETLRSVLPGQKPSANVPSKSLISQGFCGASCSGTKLWFSARTLLAGSITRGERTCRSTAARRLSSYPTIPFLRNCSNAGRSRPGIAWRSCGVGEMPTGAATPSNSARCGPMAAFSRKPSPAPVAITNHLAQQLDLPLVLLEEVPSRLATETEQLQRIREYLGWRPFDDDARARLTTWLTQHVTDDLLPGALVTRAEEILRSWQIVLPAWSTLEALVVSVTARLQDDVYTRIVTG
jgi:hypothetical protein